MSGVPGMPLPGWAPELKPCGTTAAYRRHLRRGERIDEACRQANARAWRDRTAAGGVRRLRSVHLAGGPAKCYRQDVIVTDDPEQVTCKHCLSGFRRIPWVAQEGWWHRAA